MRNREPGGNAGHRHVTNAAARARPRSRKTETAVPTDANPAAAFQRRNGGADPQPQRFAASRLRNAAATGAAMSQGLT